MTANCGMMDMDGKYEQFKYEQYMDYIAEHMWSPGRIASSRT
jgi:hypothetical protein